MTEPVREGGGPIETTAAVVICAVVMIGPIVYVQHGYESFMGDDRIIAGAAGATLALAVVMRTVSRTVLRTIVRTSARAGLKASMKGALQAGTRAATRGLFASMFKGAFGDALAGTKPKPTEPAAIRAANLRSLGFASVLLYASWVIVIGLGNPFGMLLDEAAAQETAALEATAATAARSTERRLPEWNAWDRRVEIRAKREELTAARHATKGARTDPARLAALLAEGDLNEELHALSAAYQEVLVLSKGRVVPKPDPAPIPPRNEVDDAIDWLYTHAPFPRGAALAEADADGSFILKGSTPWASPVIWAGGAIFVLPLWFIYGVQLRSAKRRDLVLRHETGIDGGMIQLYFAGAFSFMPLTSDVVVEGDLAQKGRISVIGLLAPVAVSVALWFAWKLTGETNPWILLGADAFLIYPMVQTFPLSPLDGVNVWRWGRARWFGVFFVVMGAFMFIGSEGLKNVI